MAETAALTPSELHDTLPFTGGRISIALQEVLRRLEDELPDMIDYENTRQGWTGDQLLTAPTEYQQAPLAFTADYIGSVCVSVEVDKINLGTRQFRNEAVLTVSLIEEPPGSGSQISQAWDKSDLVAAILLQYKSGCVTPDDYWAWRQLTYLGQEVLPTGDDSTFTGVQLTYRLMQDPNDTFWL